MLVSIGPYVEGEIPPSLSVSFELEGAPVDLTGHSAIWLMRRTTREGVEDFQKSATLSNPSGGVAIYDWQDGDMVTGTWSGEMWVSDGTIRLCSDQYRWVVTPSIGPPVFGP